MMHKFFIAILLFGSTFAFSDAEQMVEQKGKQLKIGIICSHPQEIGELVDHMEKPVQTKKSGTRTYYKGKLWNFDTTVVASGIGKVASATATTHLILDEGVDLIVTIGVAAPAEEKVKIGDVVIGEGFVQHDFEFPSHDMKTLKPSLYLQNLGIYAVKEFFNEQLSTTSIQPLLAEVVNPHPKVERGLVASGDQFIAHSTHLKEIKKELPQAIAIDVEAAAIAQVCFEHKIPSLYIMIISDRADGTAHKDYTLFLDKIAGTYTLHIIQNLYKQLWS